MKNILYRALLIPALGFGILNASTDATSLPSEGTLASTEVVSYGYVKNETLILDNSNTVIGVRFLGEGRDNFDDAYKALTEHKNTIKMVGFDYCQSNRLSLYTTEDIVDMNEDEASLSIQLLLNFTKVVHAIKECKQLEKLSLWESTLSPVFLKMVFQSLNKHPSLRVINFSYSNQNHNLFLDKYIQLIDTCPNLACIILRSSDPSAAQVTKILINYLKEKNIPYAGCDTTCSSDENALNLKSEILYFRPLSDLRSFIGGVDIHSAYGHLSDGFKSAI